MRMGAELRLGVESLTSDLRRGRALGYSGQWMGAAEELVFGDLTLTLSSP